MPDTKNIPIRYGKYINHEMEEEKVIFIGAEKAIYGSDGRGLDEKLIDIEDSISDAFSMEKDYSAGDYCVYVNRVFKFTKDKPAGEWDGAAVIPVSLAQEIRANAQGIAALNGRLAFGGECTVFRSGLNMDQNLMTLQSRLDEKNYITLIATDKSLYVDKIINGEVKRLFTTASKSDLSGDVIVTTFPGTELTLAANDEKSISYTYTNLSGYDVFAIVDAFSNSPYINIGNRYINTDTKTINMTLRNLASVSVKSIPHARLISKKVL